MLKFKFLGVNGSVQDPDSGNTSLLVFGKEGSLAVDLSCNLAAAVEAGIDAVILTHEHIDHVYGLASLLHQLWLGGRNKALDIYIPNGMEWLVNGLIDMFGIRQKKNMFEIRICADTVFDIGAMHVTAFSTDHTDTSIGVVIEEGEDKLVYTCDTRPVKDVPFIMNGAQVLIHEASGVMKDEDMLVKKGHSSAADAGKLAQRLMVRKLYLCHLPKGEEAKAEILGEARTKFREAYIPDVLEEIAVRQR